MKHLLLFEELKIKKLKKIKNQWENSDGGGLDIMDKFTPEENDPKSEDTFPLLKPLFKKILNKFNLSGKVKYINAGSFGMAFEVDGGKKVIKLTSDEEEANIAKSMVKKRYPHCVNYYGVVWIEKYDIFAILMDRAKTLSNKEIKFLDNDDSLGISKERAKKLSEDYNKMLKSLDKNGISTQDAHAGNLGYIGDKMVHFDITGDSSHQDMSKIIGD